MRLNAAKVLIVSLGFIFIVGLFVVNKLSLAMKDHSRWNDILINLKLLNKEMSFDFRDNFLHLNYDNINQTMQSFDQNLTELRKIQGFNILADIYKNQTDIKNIYSIYEKKRDFIDRFNYISSGAITFLIDSEYKLKQNPDFKEIELLFSRLKNVSFLDLKAVNDLEFEVQNLYINFQNAPQKLQLIKKASYILSSFLNLRQIYIQNNSLNLADYLDVLSQKYAKQYADILLILQTCAVGAFVVFWGLLIFVVYQLNKEKKDLKQIAMLKTAVDNDFTSIIFTDENESITYVNKTFEYVTGYTKNEILGKNPNFLKSYVHSAKFYDEMKNSINNHTEWCADSLISKSRDEKFIYERVHLLPFIYESKNEGYIAIKLNKTNENNILRELKLKNEQIKSQAITDKLTGFGNYFAMGEKLDTQKDGIVICITIKNFINLRFFYQTKVIEAMLYSFANTLKLCVDTYDINADLFRFQDDEFYLWYDGDNVKRDIEYIKEYFNFSDFNIVVDGKHDTLPGLKIIMGVSLINDTPQTSRLMQSILANQQANGNGIDVYYYKENDAIEMQYYKNQTITQLIEYAIENDTVIVECQGIFDVTKPNETAKFYEVLVRIIDQNGKIRYPGEFLDVAIKAQLYTQITKKVIEKAFLLVEHYPEYIFSINLSSIDMTDSSLRELLEEKLRMCANPHHVCFEMLESEDMSDYTLINSFIRRIKGYGAQISIDDFGSGYSNYYRILELDIDNIKIDGSIIKKLPFDQNARYLVETIVNFASKQGYKIVAEFVSSPEILEQIKKFNITYAQGFLLGKPKSMDI